MACNRTDSGPLAQADREWAAGNRAAAVGRYRPLLGDTSLSDQDRRRIAERIGEYNAGRPAAVTPPADPVARLDRKKSAVEQVLAKARADQEQIAQELRKLIVRTAADLGNTRRGQELARRLPGLVAEVDWIEGKIAELDGAIFDEKRYARQAELQQAGLTPAEQAERAGRIKRLEEDAGVPPPALTPLDLEAALARTLAPTTAPAPTAGPTPSSVASTMMTTRSFMANDPLLGAWVERRPAAPAGDWVRTFRADGTLTLTLPNSGRSVEGTWRRAGDRACFSHPSTDGVEPPTQDKWFTVTASGSDRLSVSMLGERKYTWERAVPPDVGAMALSPAKPVGDQPILTRLANTKWENTNGVTFEWQTGGTFLHKGVERPCKAVGPLSVEIDFGGGHRDTLVFNAGLTTFSQYSTHGGSGPLFIGKRSSQSMGPDQTRTDEQRFQGRWELVQKVGPGGKQHDRDDPRHNQRLTVTGDDFELDCPGANWKQPLKGTFTLNPDRTPKQFDLVGVGPLGFDRSCAGFTK